MITPGSASAVEADGANVEVPVTLREPPNPTPSNLIPIFDQSSMASGDE